MFSLQQYQSRDPRPFHPSIHVKNPKCTLIHYTKSIVASSFHTVKLLSPTASIIDSVLFSILNYTESNFRSASHISVKKSSRFIYSSFVFSQQHTLKVLFSKVTQVSSFPLPFIPVCISLQRFFSIPRFFFSMVSKVRTI